VGWVEAVVGVVKGLVGWVEAGGVVVAFLVVAGLGSVGEVVAGVALVRVFLVVMGLLEVVLERGMAVYLDWIGGVRLPREALNVLRLCRRN